MSDSTPRDLLVKARRIVIKVGSSTLTRDGALRTRKFGDLARQISGLMDQGREVVLVSSGAIAIGSARLNWDKPGRSIPEMQAAADAQAKADAPPEEPAPPKKHPSQQGLGSLTVPLEAAKAVAEAEKGRDD